ncbi:hypothetical protein DDB_G0285697 [Dictyostelium discoideum AX4]|uniref:Uncharacterized protein n=1 Tax=Dictyostelium discoideum TaxID=44689 RepID=Q54MS2_DICDI|nr:hypothetical protein DDB_G0285697 [Dictyostelium discoideum AX4]EAL64686.1 hypothetical protein DDB_G0285697 [Dictyostelium discoideum AX4]|eukprot:XP_638221.1 hypothetical protein DDB_G0285697 [Dictyostelium discoideum AX4]
MKLINLVIYFFLFGIVYSQPPQPHYGVFELSALRGGENKLLYRGANLKAFSQTPARPGVIVTFFRYNGGIDIYYSHRIQIVANLEESARVMTQTPNNMATSGRIVSYAYQEISTQVFNGLNVGNLNALINGPNLVTPAGPFIPHGRLINVLALLARWIRLNFSTNIQIIEFIDDHPSFPKPSESYDSNGGGSGVSNDLELAFYQKNPNGNYYLEERKHINEESDNPAGLLGLVSEGIKEAANGVKVTGVNIWNKAKSIFSHGKEAASSKTSAAVVKVENEGKAVVKAGESVVSTVKNDGKAVVNAGESVVTSVKNEGKAVVNAGESVVTSVKNNGKAVVNAGESVVTSVKNEGKAVVNAGGSVVTSVKNNGKAVVNAGETVVQTVKKEASVIVKTGETVIDSTRKGGAAFVSEGGAAIADIEKNGAQFARGVVEMGEAAGDVVEEMAEVSAGRLIVEVLEIV